MKPNNNLFSFLPYDTGVISCHNIEFCASSNIVMTAFDDMLGFHGFLSLASGRQETELILRLMALAPHNFPFALNSRTRIA